mgnify:CR=1 FL=1|tara:strand:+ start:2771 stop:2971 length:201 start_codon:yes stop_codon:yes gene_type:complete
MKNLCPHRYEIVLNFSLIGIGINKEEAIVDALSWGFPSGPEIRNMLTINKVEKSWDNDTCDICEEE